MDVKRVKEKKTFKFSELSPGDCFCRMTDSTILMKLNYEQPNAVNVKNGIVNTIIDTENVIRLRIEVHIIS